MKDEIAGVYSIEALSMGGTAVHRMDALPKLIVTIVYIAAVVSFPRYALAPLLAYAFYPCVMMAVCEIPPRLFFRRMLPALAFVAIGGVSALIFDTAPGIMLGALTVSRGTILFMTILLKAAYTVGAVLILAATTPMARLAACMARLHIPRAFILLMSLVYRYLTLIYEEARTMQSAYVLKKARGSGVALKDAGVFAGQLLIRSADRSERVYRAMLCRGAAEGGFADERGGKGALFAVLVCAAAVGLRVASIFLPV